MRITPWPLALIALSACTADKLNFPSATGPTVTDTGDGDTGPGDSQIDADGDGYAADVDCDDSSAEVNPGADEVCDGIDNDCDDEADEDPTDGSDWYPDDDGDDYGSFEEAAVTACDQPSGYTANNEDCDDTNAEVNPDADEVCDGLDNDCDNLTDSLDDDIDPGTTTTWHADSDSDGYGDLDVTTQGCDRPSGYVLDDTDCDDAAEDVNPGADELCDERDNDCDEEVDEDAVDAGTHYADADLDGYGDPADAVRDCQLLSGYTDNADDCDDTDAAISPAAGEVCDGVDNDCDGLTDDSDSSVDTTTGETFYADSDSDGFGDADDATEACSAPSGYASAAGDCDDGDAAINPDADEVCDDVDNDCDGLTDDDDDSADLSTGDTYYADADGDGYGDEGVSVEACDEPSGYVSDDSDCDDTDGDVNDAADEVCDGVDNDCDGARDDYDSSVTDTETFYRDFDGDGYGAADYSVDACEAPSSYVTDATDCDDNNSDAYPDAPEVCDGDDNDCDGDIDDDDSSVEAESQTTFYADDDEDGYGDGDDSTLACEQPSGTVTTPGDCDDSSAAISPDADEVCDGVDNDCDELIDDDDDSADLSTGDSYYADVDGDGYGDPDDRTAACDEPSGYVSDDSDCDDTDGNVNEAADEICDGVDNDCNNLTDDDDAGLDTSTATTYYDDSDGDGFGDADFSELRCEQPSGTVTDDTDCDDTDAAISPDADEVCDGTDNDCDGLTDDDDSGLDTSTADTWYLDDDRDSFGDADSSALSCDEPSGYVRDDSDCDDTNSSINPDADEVCDDVDNDCDGLTDDDDSSLDTTTADAYFLDDDGDGYGDADDSLVRCDEPSGYVSDDSDCDDTDGNISPAADEVCDAVDNDCDGDADTDAIDITTWYGDADGDGYGGTSYVKEACDQPSNYVETNTDCDDLEPAAYPDADEICDDIDNDCDGLIDDADESVDPSDGGGTWYLDDDGDGFGDDASPSSACEQPSGTVTDDSDCDDGSADINPDAQEVCDDVDNDCDGLTDDDDSSVDVSEGGETFYTDDDGDGYGTDEDTTTSCDEPSGYVSDGTDCDDTDGNVNPAATETCNGTDDDCDGLTDDDDSSLDASTADTWYLDDDGDGYGTPDASTLACDQPSGSVASSADCDDSDAAISPAADEVCDGTDNDCDGLTDDDDGDVDTSGGSTYYTDSDGDGYGDPDSTVEACDVGSGHTDDNTDCDDTDAATSPGADEACDGVDNDCDDEVDEGVIGESDCPAYSCLEIAEDDSSASDGYYYIDPDEDGDETEVYCDMTTDGGGYTYLKVDYGSSAYAADAESHCDDLGMQLFIPRTEDHQLASVDFARDSTIDTDYGTYTDIAYMYILGIYPIATGRTCSRVAFNSASCTNWAASDGGPYYVGSNTSISEPNGDNSTYGSMYYRWNDADDTIQWYNDVSGNGYDSDYFMCDVGDKWGDGVDRGD